MLGPPPVPAQARVYGAGVDPRALPGGAGDAMTARVPPRNLAGAARVRYDPPMKALLLALATAATAAAGADGGERVVLLHGMGRTPRSMDRMARGLREAGFEVQNLGYASTTRGIEDLARETLDPVFAAAGPTGRVHFVTHSLGGILVRVYAAARHPPALGRVVMLAPPNEGSELADALASNPLYRAATGPAGQQLGTGSNSVPLKLGPVDFELGVIAGNRTLNPVFSHIVPGIDDGKVSVDRARVEGMKDFLVVPSSHTWIMNDDTVIARTAQFLREGRFAEEQAGPTTPTGASQKISLAQKNNHHPDTGSPRHRAKEP